MEMASSIVKVGIVEDQRRTRDGLRALIEGSKGLSCAGAWRSMEEALSAPIQPEASRPDVILRDLGLPGMSGIEGIPGIREKWPETAVVVLTVYEDNDRVFEALCAGATGYLLKTTNKAKLVEGIHEAVRGGSPMSPGIARQVVELFRQYRPPERSNCDLTQHEVRLLRLLVDGHSYKTAAVSLSVTVNTVAFHIKSIYGKLQVHSKSEAVARAFRDNLLG
jgi:DNA-binding NarL/FixJ family response regulator